MTKVKNPDRTGQVIVIGGIILFFTAFTGFLWYSTYGITDKLNAACIKQGYKNLTDNTISGIICYKIECDNIVQPYTYCKEVICLKTNKWGNCEKSDSVYSPHIFPN